jgi:hypothetical protein
VFSKKAFVIKIKGNKTKKHENKRMSFGHIDGTRHLNSNMASTDDSINDITSRRKRKCIENELYL